MVKHFAVIEDGVVVNAVLADDAVALERGWVAMPEGAGPGWHYDGTTFTPPPASPVAVPASISFAQLLIGLVNEKWITEAEGEAWLAGALPAAVLSLIAGLPADEQFAAKARAARPSEVLRSDPLLQGMAAAMGQGDAQLDHFFVTYGAV